MYNPSLFLLSLLVIQVSSVSVTSIKEKLISTTSQSPPVVQETIFRVNLGHEEEFERIFNEIIRNFTPDRERVLSGTFERQFTESRPAYSIYRVEVRLANRDSLKFILETVFDRIAQQLIQFPHVRIVQTNTYELLPITK